jgi:methionyl-tRNA synthetase
MAKQQKPQEPEAPALPPIKDEITYDDFAKMDLRLGKVVACEEVKRSKKLLKLTVDIGSEQRTVVSGIKNWYKPEDLVGKTVVVVANLKPVTLCGVESHGMILCASDPEDRELAFVTPAKGLTPGWVVR